MLHEVLFSVWNCRGQLFTETDKEWQDMIELHKFITPADRQILEKIIGIVSMYHSIEKFCKEVTTKHTIQYEAKINKNDENEVIKYGMYLKAFCNGLDECLNEYRESIVKLEDEILQNPQINLTYILANVEKYLDLFYALKSMIRMVKCEQNHGCLLIGKLYSYTRLTISDISIAAHIIVKSVNTRFYRQLSCWMIYADIVDIYDEFFIKDCNCDDENFMRIENVDESDNPASIKAFNSQKQHSIRKFVIVPSLVPSIINRNTAETILFIGRIVWILENDPQQKAEAFRRDIWNEKSVECYKKIQELGNTNFHLEKLQDVVEECRIELTKYLWHVMVEDANLLKHLQLIRDYYCLGRGELFQQFIILARDQLTNTCTDTLLKKLNSVFKESASKMYSESDASYKKFEIIIPKNCDPSECAIYNLELHFDVSWPLHIIFHPKVLNLYNKMFNFLLRLKMTDIDLHYLWLNHMGNRKRLYPGIWTLRHNLKCLLNNIQYYLHVDVIESEISTLNDAIMNVNEFNDIIRLHSTFLTNLLSKTFMISASKKADNENHYSLYQVPSLNIEDNNTIYKIIILFIELCDDFCLKSSKWDIDIQEEELVVLKEMHASFNLLFDTLRQKLFSLHEKVSGKHFFQLLYRLDLNRWHAKQTTDLNLTIS